MLDACVCQSARGEHALCMTSRRHLSDLARDIGIVQFRDAVSTGLFHHTCDLGLQCPRNVPFHAVDDNILFAVTD